MNNNDWVRQWLEKRFSPVCLLASSEHAEIIAKKSGMTVFQLFKPFEVMSNADGADVFVRGVSNNDAFPLKKDFQIRYMRPDNLREFHPEARVDYFTTLLARHSQNDRRLADELGKVLQDITQSEDITRPTLTAEAGNMLVRRSFPRRHNSFTMDYVSMLRCSYFDTYDHPVAVMHVLGATRDPADVREQLAAIGSPMVQAQQITLAMEDEVCRLYVILHDASTTTPDEAEACLRVVVNVVGNPSHVAVVPMNTFSVEGGKEMAANPELWIGANTLLDSYCTIDSSKRRIEEPVKGQCAQKLSLSDVAKMRKVTSNFIARCIVPFIEKRVRELSSYVSINRQTTLSKVANWFRSSEKSQQTQPKDSFAVPAGGKDPQYVSKSLEMRIRRCGDLLFFLRDLEGAQQYYRMARDDWTTTKPDRLFNGAYIAAAQEGIGLTYYFLNRLPLPGGKDECRLETARADYSIAQVHSYSFRSSLILIAICRHRGNAAPHNDKALQLIENSLQAVHRNAMYRGVLSEMAAMCLLVQNPPHSGFGNLPPVAENFSFVCNPRRFALKYSEAGEAFGAKGLPDHAIRCTLVALEVYREQGFTSWSKIHEVLFLRCSRWLTQLGQHKAALGYLSAAIYGGLPFVGDSRSGKTITESLDLYFKSLQTFCVEHKVSRIPFLCIPSVELLPDPSVSQHQEDEGTLALGGKKLSGVGSYVGAERLVEDEFINVEGNLRGYVATHNAEVNGALLPIRKGGPEFDDPFLARQSPKSAEVTTPVEEAVSISFKLKNPLGVSIEVGDLHLVYHTFASEEDFSSANYGSLEEVKCTSPDSVLLGPKASSNITVTFTPKKEGIVWVVGLQWRLGAAVGRFYFDTLEVPSKEKIRLHPEHCFPSCWDRAVGAPTTTAGGGGGSPGKEETASESTPTEPPKLKFHPTFIQIRVVAPRGNVSLELHPPLPTTMRDGEIYTGEVVLRNLSSSEAVHGIVLQLGREGYHLVRLRLPECADPGKQLDDQEVFNLTKAAGCTPLLPKAEYRMNINFRANFGGPGASRSERVTNHLMMCVGFYSEKEDRTKMRVHRFGRKVAVRPSLHVDSRAVAPTMDGKGYIVSLKVANHSYRMDSPLRLCRVIVAAKGWKVANLGVEELTKETALGCYLGHASSLALPLQVLRSAESDTTQDFVCLDASQTIGTNKAELCEKQLDAKFAHSPTAWSFCHTSLRGAGVVGKSEANNDDFVFYQDGNDKVEDEETVVDNKGDNANKKTAPVFPPILVALAWSADTEGATQYGQTYHWIDPRNCGGARSYASDEVSPEALCESTQKGTTANSKFGALLLTGVFPRHLPGHLGVGRSVMGSVGVKLQNLTSSSVNVVIAVKLPPQLYHRPFLYCGRTTIRCTLTPDEVRNIEFKVQFFSPGTFDVNLFEVKASPCLNGGGADGDNASLVESVEVFGKGIPWPVTISHEPSKDGATSLPTASPSRPQGRLRQLSRISAKGVAIPMVRKPVGSETREGSMSTATRLSLNKNLGPTASQSSDSSSSGDSSSDGEEQIIPSSPTEHSPVRTPVRTPAQTPVQSPTKQSVDDLPTTGDQNTGEEIEKWKTEVEEPSSANEKLKTEKVEEPSSLVSTTRSRPGGVFDEELSSDEENEILQRRKGETPVKSSPQPAADRDDTSTEGTSSPNKSQPASLSESEAQSPEREGGSEKKGPEVASEGAPGVMDSLFPCATTSVDPESQEAEPAKEVENENKDDAKLSE